MNFGVGKIYHANIYIYIISYKNWYVYIYIIIYSTYMLYV
jgi:hypothetical protein